jgi:Asp-tRNA(Asn)/Glu-tRNA(Gln) amidotransferase A subunit family amidase
MTDIVTLRQLSDAIHTGDISSREITETVLARADRLDEAMGTYISRFDEQALQAASRLDAELQAGRDRGPLHGIPIGIKDIIATDDGPTTAQSLILDPAWGDQGDAPVVARLRAAGAVVMGKTTTMEFAIGCPDPTKPFPIPRNPWDLTRWPGGSSSGSGSGVAAGLFFGALGTDTGGSIRCPAAFCGISGLKPTFGAVPKSGCTPLGYSYDHIGPMARSAEDCAVMLQIMAGRDASDPTSSTRPVGDLVAPLDGDLHGIRVGVDRTVLDQHAVDPALSAVFDAAVASLSEAGAAVVDVEIPHYAALVSATMCGSMAEALAIHLADLRTRWSDYGQPTRAAIARGALVGAIDYVQAQRVRSVGSAAVAELMQRSCDVVVTPTAVLGAPKVEGLSFATILSNVLTPIWNAVGFPALSVPMGTTDGGLPLGLQIAGPPYADALVLKVGDAYQRLTEHHLQRPGLISAGL